MLVAREEKWEKYMKKEVLYHNEVRRSSEWSIFDQARADEYDNLTSHKAWKEVDWNHLPKQWPKKYDGEENMSYARRIGALNLFAIYRVCKSHEEDKLKVKCRMVFPANKLSDQRHVLSYSPTVSRIVIRFLLGLAIQWNYFLGSLDVTGAYLNAENEIPIPTLINKSLSGGAENKLVVLTKALYGLPEAGRLWNKLLNRILQQIGFIRSINETCLYFRRNQEGECLLGVYVDDILICSSTKEVHQDFIKEFKKHLKIGAEDELPRFVGVDIVYGKGYVACSMKGYADICQEKFDMLGCTFKNTPLTLTTENAVPEKIAPQDLPKLIAAKMGSLRWAAECGVFELLGSIRHDNVDRALRYWFGIKDILTFYRRDGSLVAGQLGLEGVCDGRWGDQPRYGYIIRMNEKSAPFMAVSRKIKITCLSATDCEIFALCELAKSIMWIVSLYKEIGVEPRLPVVLWSDCKPAISQVMQEKPTEASRYYINRVKFIKDCISAGQLTVSHVPGKFNAADPLTRALDAEQFKKVRCMLRGMPLLLDDDGRHDDKKT
jgi:hypothetical protein